MPRGFVQGRSVIGMAKPRHPRKSYPPDSREDLILSARRLFGRLGDEEGRYIMVHLARENASIVPRVQELRRSYAALIVERMKGVDVDEVARSVLSDLNHLDPEWADERAGSDRYGGYYDPSESAGDMFQEEMEGCPEYVADLWKKGLRQDAAAYSLGVLKGVALFYVEGKTGPREHFGEYTYGFAQELLEKWTKLTKGGKWLLWVTDRLPQTIPPRFLRYLQPENERSFEETAKGPCQGSRVES